MYLLFNESGAADNYNQTEFVIAYKDKTTLRVINLTVPTEINGSSAYNEWKIDLAYGGPGATSTFSLAGIFDDATLLNTSGWGLFVNSSTTPTKQFIANYTNNTVASTSLTPTLMIGPNSGTADANDIKALVEGSTSDVSTQVGDLISDGGIQAYSVKSNTESGKLVIGVPPETVYGLLQFGKIGPTTTGGVCKDVVAITTAVAKLDSEITATDKANKNLVLVGGPCANTLVQALVDASKIDAKYTCAGGKPGTAWAANTAYIIVADDAFATGKKVVVVAGTSAADTRLASTVLQQYATKLASITGSTATITGTAIATATIK
jgi:hypothetical protein